LNAGGLQLAGPSLVKGSRFSVVGYVTPAMAAGVTDRLWEVSDLVAMLESDERRVERAA